MSLSARGPAECGARNLLFVGHASSNGRALEGPKRDVWLSGIGGRQKTKGTFWGPGEGKGEG